MTDEANVNTRGAIIEHTFACLKRHVFPFGTRWLQPIKKDESDILTNENWNVNFHIFFDSPPPQTSASLIPFGQDFRHDLFSFSLAKVNMVSYSGRQTISHRIVTIRPLTRLQDNRKSNNMKFSAAVLMATVGSAAAFSGSS